MPDVNATITLRTTISIDPEIVDLARERMKSLRIKAFSHYLALLIEKDHRDGGTLVVVKEESGKYRNKKP